MKFIDVSTPTYPDVHMAVDDEDFARFGGIKWTFDGRGYARRCEGKLERYLHRDIAGAQPGEFVDHRDGNTLDCRRGNLRRCSVRQNCLNQKVKGATSRFKGVSWHAARGKWQVKIRIEDGRRLFIGRFDSEEEAARAYDQAAIKHHLEYAKTNVMLGLLPASEAEAMAAADMLGSFA